MADDLKRLVAFRGQLKGAITRMLTHKKAQEADPGTVDPISAKQKLDRLHKVFNEYNELNLEILLLDPADDERVQDIEDKFDELCTFYSRIIQSVVSGPPLVSTNPAPATGERTGFRLPRIELHKFNGEIRPLMMESTALGAAIVAGRALRVWPSTTPSPPADTFIPALAAEEREIRRVRWEAALARSMGWATHNNDAECKEDDASVDQTTNVLPSGLFFLATAVLVVIADKLKPM